MIPLVKGELGQSGPLLSSANLWWVQLMARVYGEFYHARGVTAELRDVAVGGRTTQQAYDGIAWLYGGP